MRLEKLAVTALTLSLILPGNLFARFKDASPAINRAAEEFDKQGILDGFISKYGDSYFRPTTTVTREDLLLTLHEYDLMIKTLRDYRSQVSKSMASIKKQIESPSRKKYSKKGSSGGLSKKQIDIVVREVQERFPVLLKSAGVPKKLDKRLDDIDQEISAIWSKQDNILNSEKIRKVIRKEVRRELKRRGAGTSLGTEKKESTGLLAKVTIGTALLAGILIAR